MHQISSLSKQFLILLKFEFEAIREFINSSYNTTYKLTFTVNKLIYLIGNLFNRILETVPDSEFLSQKKLNCIYFKFYMT